MGASVLRVQAANGRQDSMQQLLLGGWRAIRATCPLLPAPTARPLLPAPSPPPIIMMAMGYGQRRAAPCHRHPPTPSNATRITTTRAYTATPLGLPRLDITQSYHPLCARIAGLHMEMVEDGAGGLQSVTFCARHAKPNPVRAGARCCRSLWPHRDERRRCCCVRAPAMLA